MLAIPVATLIVLVAPSSTPACAIASLLRTLSPNQNVPYPRRSISLTASISAPAAALPRFAHQTPSVPSSVMSRPVADVEPLVHPTRGIPDLALGHPAPPVPRIGRTLVVAHPPDAEVELAP